MARATGFQDTPASVLVRYPLVSASPDVTLHEACAIFREQSVSTLVLVEDGQLVGILTERDLVARTFRADTPGDTPVAELMTRDPVTLAPDATVGEVLRLLDTERFRHVPVVSANGRPFGVISVRDLLEFLAESMPELALNQPPDPTRPLRAPEGG